MILERKWLAYLGLQLDVQNRQLIWPKTIPPTPSFIKEISITMENLVQLQINTTYQADAMCRDQAFEKDIQLNLQQIYILCRPQIAYTMPPTTETQEVSKEPAKTPIGNLDPMQLQRTIKNTECHTKLIDQKDNLQKMEYKLKRTVNFRPQNTAQKTAVKKLTDLPPVNICYIGAVGFYWNLVQPDTIAFTTSLYEID